MKKIFLVLFSLLISFNSYGEWVLAACDTECNKNGNKFYVDKDTIKKKNGHIYYWQLVDYHKPLGRFMSSVAFHEGDCSLNRHRKVSHKFYIKPMGNGKPIPANIKTNEPWTYNSPDSVGILIIKYACNAR